MKQFDFNSTFKFCLLEKKWSMTDSNGLLQFWIKFGTEQKSVVIAFYLFIMV